MTFFISFFENLVKILIKSISFLLDLFRTTTFQNSSFHFHYLDSHNRFLKLQYQIQKKTNEVSTPVVA